MEALRSGLHEHKENVQATLDRGKLSYASGSAKMSVKYRPYSTPKSKKAGDKKKAAKSRRALGDISNRHNLSQTGGESGPNTHTGKKRVGVTLKAHNSTATPQSSKKVPSVVTSTLVSKRNGPRADEPEEIERAYGGLSSSRLDEHYISQIRSEIFHELVNNSTPTILDQQDSLQEDLWRHEKLTLDDMSPPSSWWTASATEDLSFATPCVVDRSCSPSGPLDVPEPDDASLCIEEPDDGLLDEVLDAELTNADEPLDSLHNADAAT